MNIYLFVSKLNKVDSFETLYLKVSNEYSYICIMYGSYL